MFADQALMVHPEDKRFTKYIGKSVYIPGTKVKIPVITDDYVDMEFGTGVVKVTPAHDPNDFEVGKRHNLDMPLCMHEDGTMNEMAHIYEGLDRFVCREKLVEDLRSKDLLEQIESYTNNIGYSERTGVIVEPRLSLQWFVKMDELSKQALDESTSEFVPSRFKKIFVNWMTDTYDWCISRQLWWGHRIPAWYKDDQVKVQIESPGDDWTQDEDVLDTWFSSALWPFSTLGWPEITEDFKRYYPTSVMVTGYDIIFFWVARMIFQGLEFTKQDPFEKVLIHGLIRDSQGRKMSKSLGNGVDPMDVIDQYGVDALRYFLTTNSAPGSDLRYEEEKVESSWNFINKLWNITRFITMNIEDIDVKKESDFNLADQWILSRLSETIKEADYNYEKFEFGEVSRSLYHFIWEDFANWYVEFAKVSLKDEKQKKTTQWVLIKVLKDILKLMHPFIPFVTEKLFLEISTEETIMLSQWPKADYCDQTSIDVFNEVKDVITKVRNLRAEHNVAPSKPLDIELVIENKNDLEVVSKFDTYFTKFLNTNALKLSQNITTHDETIVLVGSKIIAYVLKSDVIDPLMEKQALMKQQKDLENEIKRSESLLQNEKFISKAPESKINLEKEKYEDYKKQYEIVVEKLKTYV
jgi:valyl-tRNA synthetase